MINLYRQLGKVFQVSLILVLFSFITPIGIMIGIGGNTYISARLDSLLTASFSAFAAGTFLYIGTVHSHHLHEGQQTDSYHQYTKVIATIIGVALMAIVGIWI